MKSREVNVYIDDKVFKGILVEGYMEYRTKKRIRRGDRVIETETTERRIMVYINRENIADYYLVIPLKKDQVKIIDEYNVEILE